MADQSCPHCGYQHRSTAVFCPNTGKPLDPRPPAVGDTAAAPVTPIAPAPPVEPATPVAPAPPVDFCRNCGRLVEPNWQICTSCGAPLAKPDAAQVPPPPRYEAPVPRPVSPPNYGMPAQPPRAPVPPMRNEGQPAQAGGKLPKKSWLACCSIGAVGSLVLLLVLCVGSILVLGLNENNRTAKMIPAEETELFISFSPTLMQLPSLVYADRFEKSFGIFGAIPGMSDVASIAEDSLFQELDLDPQRDILPWIGNEVSMAVFKNGAFSAAPDGVKMVSSQYGPSMDYYGPSVLLSAASRNTRASNAFLNRLYRKLEENGGSISNYEYKGVKINTISGSSEVLAVATYRNMVLVSTNMAVIESVIDSAGKPKQTLYQQKNFQDMLKRLPANRLGMMFMDMQDEEDSYFDPQDLVLASLDAVGGSFSLEASGMRFDYLLKYNTDGMLPSQLQAMRETSSQNALLSKLPGDSVFYVNGQDFSLLTNTFFEQMSKQYEEDTEEVFSSFRSQYGLDLREDFLDYMHGEYAVAFSPEGSIETSSSLGLPAGFTLAIQVNDARKIQQNASDLLRAIARESDARAQTDTVNGNEIIWFESDYSGQFGLGCVVNGDVLYIGTSENLLRTLAGRQNPSLADAPAFRNAVRALPNKERFYMVLDVQNILTLFTEDMSGSARADFEEQYEPYLKDMESLSLSVGKLDNAGIVHGQMRIGTK